MDATTPTTKACRCRRAFSLIESMFASVILAVFVAALSSALSASYAHDRAAMDRVDAIASAEHLMEQAIALPVVAEGRPSIASLNNLVDQVVLKSAEDLIPRAAPIISVVGSTTDTLVGTVNTVVATTVGTTSSLIGALLGGTSGTPSGNAGSASTEAEMQEDAVEVKARLAVSRHISVNQNDGSIAASLARNAPNELAWIRVRVTTPDGAEVVVRRLVHRGEAR